MADDKTPDLGAEVDRNGQEVGRPATPVGPRGTGNETGDPERDLAQLRQSNQKQ